MPSATTEAEVINPTGAAPVLLICEHASAHIPESYDGLGLRPEDRDSHAAWDPGARALAVALSRALDAPLVAGTVSRLVYDCNRPPDAPSAMPAQSERIAVPGNRGLTQAQRAARVASIYEPFCAAVNAVRRSCGSGAVVTVHSFTPVYHGTRRKVEIGILHDSDSRLADAMLARKGAVPDRQIERNEPYGPEDEVMHSLKIHGVAHGLLNVMIEVRNDLLADKAEVSTLAQEILSLLTPALSVCGVAGVAHA